MPAVQRAHAEDPTFPLQTRMHAFRHTHASLCLAKTRDLFEVQRRLGHRSIDTTTRVYGHLLESAFSELLKELDDLTRDVIADPSIELASRLTVDTESDDPAGASLPEFDDDDEDTKERIAA